jgi:hypothetical protein
MSPQRAYDVHFSVRVTRSELATLRANAARHDQSLSRFLVGLGLVDRPGWSGERRRAYERAMVQFRRATNTLEQIAHAVTAGRGVTDGRLGAALAEITAAGRAVERVFEP